LKILEFKLISNVLKLTMTENNGFLITLAVFQLLLVERLEVPGQPLALLDVLQK